jgi:hypothetical protein
MPFLAYVDARRSEPGDRRPPWEPNWRVWRWVGAALVVGFAAGHAAGAVQYLLLLVVIALVCLAIDEAMPSMRGLRDWRQ